MPGLKKKFNEKEGRGREAMQEVEKIEEGHFTTSKKAAFDKDAWQPKTILGKKVKSGEITDIEYIMDNGLKVLEPEIADILLPNLSTELLLFGQSRGKFGGGQRRIFKQTQKKTNEGNKPKFASFAATGNYNGYIGIGYGKSKETVPSREKAIRNSKLNMIKIKRGCGSWQCGCKEPHTIPYEVEGKSGSVIIHLMPAPKGTGLRVGAEIAKMLMLAGIKDVWSKTEGKTKTRANLIHSCRNALKNLMEIKTKPEDIISLGIVEGAIKKEAAEEVVMEQAEMPSVPSVHSAGEFAEKADAKEMQKESQKKSKAKKKEDK